MISLPHAVRVFLHTPATDLRKGFDALSGLVTTAFYSKTQRPATCSCSSIDAAIASRFSRGFAMVWVFVSIDSRKARSSLARSRTVQCRWK